MNKEIQNKPLDEIYESIRSEIKEALQDNDKLEDIEDITFGERKHIGRLKSPSIWIVPDSYTPDFHGGNTVQHDFPFEFVTLVKSNKPQEGLEKAQELSFLVYDVLVKDRTLNGTVSDVRPERVDPAYDMGDNTQLFWSAIKIVFRLKRRE